MRVVGLQRAQPHLFVSHMKEGDHMPNLMQDIFSTSTSFNTLRNLKKEADTIKSTFMEDIKNTGVAVSNFKRTNPVVQRITRWFSKETDNDDDHSILEDKDEEFDAGFHYDNNETTQESEESTDDTSTVKISEKETKNLFNEHTRQMMQIASKNMDVSLHNMFHIKKNIDTRVSEILASTRTTESIVKTISHQLDQLIKFQVSEDDRLKRLSRNTLFDSSGKMTLNSVMNFIKMNQTKVTKTMTQSLMDITGLTNLDQRISETIESYTHSFLRQVIKLPGLRDIIGNKNTTPNKDYSDYIVSRYDRNQAIFDNMTRKSIVHIIPDYLKKIAHFATGKRYNISKSGDLTTRSAQEQFESTINVTFDISGFSERQIKSYTQQAQTKNNHVSSADTKEVLRLLVSQYVAQLYKGTTNTLRADQLKSGGDQAIHKHVLNILIHEKGKTIAYWNSILEAFTMKLRMDRHYREEFAISVNHALKRLDEAATQYIAEAQTITDSQFTQKMFDTMAKKRLSYDSTKFEHEGKTLRQLIKEKVISKDSLTRDQLEKLDEKIESFEELYEKLDKEVYLSTDEKLTDVQELKTKHATEIFDILNRGINVFHVTRRKPFGPIQLAKLKTFDTKAPVQNIDMSIPIQENSNFTSTQPLQQAKIFKKVGDKVSGFANKIKNKLRNPFQRMKDNVKSDYETFINDPSKQKNLENKASEEDQAKVKEINAMLKTAVDSGMSQNDISAIRTKVSSISDENLKIQTKKTIDGVIERGGKAPEAKSMLGRALLFVFGLAKKFVSGVISKIKAIFDKRNNFIMRAIDDGIKGVKQGAKTLKEGFVGTNESRGILDRLKPIGNIASKVVSAPINALSNIGQKISDKFQKSNFGKGFMKAMHMGDPVPVSTHDKTSRSISDILATGAGTVFESVVKSINYMGDKANEWLNQEVTKKTGQEEQEKQKKTESKFKTKEQPKVGFAMGMIMGGMTKIMSNIFAAVAKALFALKGFQALMKVFKDAITKIVKPINKTFQQLNKAIQKPLAIITDTFSKIVDAVSDIAVALIEIFAPTLQGILPLVEQMLPIMTTIYDITKEVVSDILAPIFAITSSIIAPVLQDTSNTQTSIKDAVTSSFGLVGQITSGILSVVTNIAGFLTGSVADKVVAKQMGTMSGQLVEHGAEGVTNTAQQRVALYNNVSAVTSNATESESARTNSTNEQQPEFTGSPMDGVYGSGNAGVPYKFNDSIQNAIDNLQEIVGGITSIFTGGETDVFKSVDKSTTAQKYKQAQYDTAALTSTEREAIDKRAFEIFSNGTTTERLEGETDAEYRARYEKVKEKYWAQAAMEAVKEKVKSAANGTDDGAVSIINSVVGTTAENFLSSMDEMYNQTESGGLERMMQDYPMYSEDDMYYDDGGEYYDDGSTGYYYEGGSGDIIKAASEVFVATRKAAGHELKQHGEWISNVRFDDGMVIDAVSDMCTGMMSAIVKRMGYYLPSRGKQYTDKYQGDIGMTPTIGANSWGLDNGDGRPNIYDRNGNKSQDWIIVKDGSHQAGDLSFATKSTKAVHGHVPVFKNNKGYWFGFNGGRWDSRANSIRLGEYYLSHGNLPPNDNPGYQSEGKPYDQQIGALAPPMSHTIRYVGPKTSGSVRKVAVSNSSSRGRSSASSVGYNTGAVSGKEALIRAAAEIFEAYQKTNPALTYQCSLWSKPITTRSGHTRKIRPDCSGTLSAAIQELGYTLKVNGVDTGDSGLRSIQLGKASSNTFIYDSPTATTPSKDWIVLDYSKDQLQRGDIITYPNSGTGKNDGHVTMPIVDLQGTPRGFDGGSGLSKSPAAAVAYLNGSSDIPWVKNSGMAKMKKIWRYVGSSTSSANQLARNRQQNLTRSTANRSRVATTAVTGGNVIGGNKALTAAAETMIAIKKAYGDAPTQGTWIKNVKFDDGMVIDGVSAMCTGTQAAIVKRMGYYLPADSGKSYSSTYQGNPYMRWANGTPEGWGINNADGHPNIFDRNGNKSQDWVVLKNGTYQAGDITLPSKAWGRTDKTAWHAHMGAFQYKGKWYGFNGGNPNGSNAQTNKSINLANFYLQHGRMPNESDNININDYNAQGGNQGVIIRYVGPQTGGSSLVGTSTRSRGRASSYGGATQTTSGATRRVVSSSGGKADFIRQVAMMFEGYYYNGDKVYDNGKKGLGTIHKVPMRDGRTVKVRPDCSGMLGGAISAFGYDLQYPPSSTHYNIVGFSNSWKSGWNPTYIKDKNGNVSKDWEFWKIKDTTIQPGDILGREGHATFAVAGSGNNWRGMDAGGTSNIKESAQYAKEYLDTGNTNWRGIKVSDMVNILRYVGGGSGTTYEYVYDDGTVASTSGRRGRSTGGNVRVASSANTSRTRGRTRTTASTSRVVNPNAPLTGSSNAEKVYNYLTINKGMSPVGAAGMMGCFEHESGFKPNILEIKYKKQWGYPNGDAGDVKYTNEVDTRKESEWNFVHSRGLDNKVGYGIAAFTASNVKQDVYDRTVKRGKTIASIDAQMDSVMNSLNKAKFKGTTLANAISSASTPTEANQYFLWRYEAGTGYTSDAAVNKAYGHDVASKRHTSAEKWYRQFGSGDVYTDTIFDTEQFNPSPIVQFMNTLPQGDSIYQYENIPYQPMNGPMYIPPLDVNGQQGYYEDNQFVTINQVNLISETQELLQHIDDILCVDYNVQSTTIRQLADQIYEEFPEYMDWYFSDEDGYSDEELTEDDMEILEMASAFI